MQDDALKHNDHLSIVSEAVKYVDKGLERNLRYEDAACTSGLIP